MRMIFVVFQKFLRVFVSQILSVFERYFFLADFVLTVYYGCCGAAVFVFYDRLISWPVFVPYSF